MKVIFIILIFLGIYIYRYKRDKVELFISKLKNIGQEKQNDVMFFNKKLNDEFENSSFLYDTISNINQNSIDYVGIYPDRMEIDNEIVDYNRVGMSQLEGIGECKALALYIQSNLLNRNKYEIDEISNVYAQSYDDSTIGYSVIDKNKKYKL